MGRYGWRWLAVATFCALLAGCVAQEEAPAASAVSDATEVSVHQAELGSSLDFVVRAKPAGVKAGNDHVKLVRFGVEQGTTFAVVARRQDDSALDLYLALYPPDDNHPVTVSDADQALVPMAAEADGVVVHTAARGGDYLAFVADRELAVDGAFQLDIVGLDIPPVTLDLAVTDPALRHLTDLLRQSEPQLMDYLAAGALTEGADGLLVKHPGALPSLQEVAQLNGFVAQINDLRGELYRSFVTAAGAEGDLTLQAQVGVVCGALWSALRTERHLLR